MVSGKEVITVKQEVWLKVPYQPSFPATINYVEEDIFWTNLPRGEGQVLLLQEKQTVEIGLSLAEGFYSADSHVVKMGEDHNKFYGFSIPENFTMAQERQFLRVPYATNVLFAAGGLVAQTALVNFSAGGVMVYLVPELEKILASGKEITISLNIDNIALKLPVYFAWRKSYDNIPFAGFEFQNLDTPMQDTIADLAKKYSKNK
ncbi:MAG: PilZ domain protein [Pelotomaculum sp. PtaB.Bin013]|uniref:PilZ domain-containing protein n=1 Tax=Pelotomaculum isophthalicicum JI TaxID=947010 RepID=A0A9X4H6L6_9FIRM|nr:PilZ domain-containing protein [Pelotomaculum isophthalicicum]MDF9409407.1 PilZ domain-containing protein [Pelotomaculum isophthalicicum JI]OPX91752.1 MAG: PilZ domain protein [Pelotomaculum sp. PtaB.Bin013]